jgi:hypothetical protein
MPWRLATVESITDPQLASVSSGCLTTTDNHEIMTAGAAYAEPPWVVPSTILDGGPVNDRDTATWCDAMTLKCAGLV